MHVATHAEQIVKHLDILQNLIDVRDLLRRVDGLVRPHHGQQHAYAQRPDLGSDRTLEVPAHFFRRFHRHAQKIAA
jgi:hypothetical protein